LIIFSAGGHIYKDVETGLIGSYQVDNGSVATEVAEYILGNEKELKDGRPNEEELNGGRPNEEELNGGRSNTENIILEGLKETRLGGRFEKIKDNPAVYIDGAHNPGAVTRLRETIELYFTNKKIVFIIGVLADKDYEEELK